jgi:hypothetical protein
MSRGEEIKMSWEEGIVKQCSKIMLLDILSESINKISVDELREKLDEYDYYWRVRWFFKSIEVVCLKK